MSFFKGSLTSLMIENWSRHVIILMSKQIIRTWLVSAATTINTWLTSANILLLGKFDLYVCWQIPNCCTPVFFRLPTCCCCGGIECSKLRIFIKRQRWIPLIPTCWLSAWSLISDNLRQTRAALMKWADRHPANASLCNQRVNCMVQIWIIQWTALKKKIK